MPLNHTDPSGYFKLKDALKIVAVVVAGIVTAGAALWIGGVIAGGALTGLSAAVVGGFGFGFGSAFSGSLLNGGSIGDAFKAGLIGGITSAATAGLFYGVGSAVGGIENAFGRELARTLGHGVVGGAIEEARGGEFRHGFYASAATAAAGPNPLGISGSDTAAKAMRTAVAAVVGGTASAIGGGKFANGAITGAFQHLYNAEKHGEGESRNSLTRMLTRSVVSGAKAVANWAVAHKADIEGAGELAHGRINDKSRRFWTRNVAPRLPQWAQQPHTMAYGGTARGAAIIGIEYDRGIYGSLDIANLRADIGDYQAFSVLAGYDIGLSVNAAHFSVFDISGTFNAINGSYGVLGGSLYFDNNWNATGQGIGVGLGFPAGGSWNPSWTSVTLKNSWLD